MHVLTPCSNERAPFWYSLEKAAQAGTKVPQQPTICSKLAHKNLAPFVGWSRHSFMCLNLSSPPKAPKTVGLLQGFSNFNPTPRTLHSTKECPNDRLSCSVARIHSKGAVGKFATWIVLCF